MKEMSAKDAARNFSAMLSAVESGETFVVTRSGRRIAQVAPAPRGNIRALREVVERWNASSVLDDEFEANVAAAVAKVDVEQDADPWSD